MRQYNTIPEIKEANRAAGQHWFSEDTMRFFKTKIVSSILQGQYFITSERNWDNLKMFSIRKAEADGQIETIGEFHAFKTKVQAKNALKEHLKAQANG